MNDCNGHEGLLLIIGELLLQESIVSRSDGLKGRALALIHLHFLKLQPPPARAVSAANCRSYDIWSGFGRQNLRVAEDVALARSERSSRSNSKPQGIRLATHR